MVPFRRLRLNRSSPPEGPKPITVASTPLIGNYQLPPMDFLQHPDLTVKPTESKEELMANARLMQQTLGQFDIDVSLGDITKGPTITRYELHPAPGVKLEKITALSNNIAAALKAERIHILAPVPGKKLRRRGSSERDQDQRSSCATCSNRMNGVSSKARIHSGVGQGCLRAADCRRPRRNAASAYRRKHWFRKIRVHQCDHCVAAL